MGGNVVISSNLLEQKYYYANNKHDNLPWFDLQYFAAEDEGRTEDPTELKLKRAREEGRVPKTQELSPVVVMFAILILVRVLAPSFTEEIANMCKDYISKISDVNKNYTSSSLDEDLSKIFFSYYLKIMIPILLFAFVIAFVANVVQVGFMITPKAFKMDFKKIIPNFPQYIKKSFFGIEAFYNLGKSFFKIILITLFTYFFLMSVIKKIIAMTNAPLWDSAIFMAEQSHFLMMATAVFLLVLSVVDYFFQKRQFKEQMRMTKRDIKDEMKESYGNPLIKSRLRQRMMDILKSTMMTNVKKADVIITNPTHFAVALQFEIGVHQAPIVIAKGADNLAQSIKKIANDNRIPIIENRPLARALYALVEVGNEIPSEYWQAVINILVLVDKISGKRKFTRHM